MKKRFRILTAPPSYPYECQVKLVLALSVLHNFIRKECGDDTFVREYDDERIQQDSNFQEGDAFSGNGARPDSAVKLWRQRIAENMWDDYINARRL